VSRTAAVPSVTKWVPRDVFRALKWAELGLGHVLLFSAETDNGVYGASVLHPYIFNDLMETQSNVYRASSSYIRRKLYAEGFGESDGRMDKITQGGTL
jgi:hypothetical protein